ncbi:MAG: fibronectin type III domain-containing protein [Candidatus Eisenbacteria bacterium]
MIARRLVLLTVSICALALVGGCCDDKVCDVFVDNTPPQAPRGVFTVTGDGEVDIYWVPNSEPDLAGYRVYWNDEPTGYYEFMAATSSAHYKDTDVVNGTTYYYAVSAFDREGNESSLSSETIFDTPRPEGFDLVLYNYLGSSSSLSGYDFSTYSRQSYALTTTDIYFGYANGEYVMIAHNPVPDWPRTDIQDAGYRELDELDYAPPAGWAENGWVWLTVGHSYYVWTRDNHYAKFYVKQLEPARVVIDWAYQTALDNRELAARKTATGGRSGGSGLPSESTPAGGASR